MSDVTDPAADATPESPPAKKRRPDRAHALTPTRKLRKRALRPRDIAEVERMKEALDMRKRGRTFDDIAKKLGFSHASGASKFVKRALEMTIQESADEVRKIELERYDMVLRGLLPQAERGDARAAEVCIKLFERRAKIEGLDAPERKELAIDGELRNVNLAIDATDRETQVALHELLRRRPAQVIEVAPAPAVVLEAPADAS